MGKAWAIGLILFISLCFIPSPALAYVEMRVPFYAVGDLVFGSPSTYCDAFTLGINSTYMELTNDGAFLMDFPSMTQKYPVCNTNFMDLAETQRNTLIYSRTYFYTDVSV